jgi:hypothetical protein
VTDTDETPDDIPDQFPDQSKADSDDQNKELRTDGGAVATELVGDDHPNGTVTPEGPTDQGTPRADTPQTDPSPELNETTATDDLEDPTNSASKETRNGDELFSGPVPVNDVLDFYLETNPWGVTRGTISSYRTRLRYFRQFCAEADIENLRKIQSSHIDEFHNYLNEGKSLAVHGVDESGALVRTSEREAF